MVRRGKAKGTLWPGSLAFGLALVLLSVGLALGLERLEEAKSLNQQAMQLYEEGRYREAISLAERALAIQEKVLDPDHPDVVDSLSNLAKLYHALGDYARAEPLMRRVLATSVGLVRGQGTLEEAASFNERGAQLYQEGRYLEAIPLAMLSLTIREEALPPNDPRVAQSLNNLATLYMVLRDYS